MELGGCHKVRQQKIGFSQGLFEDGTGQMPQGEPAKKLVSAKARLRMEPGWCHEAGQ